MSVASFNKGTIEVAQQDRTEGYSYIRRLYEIYDWYVVLGFLTSRRHERQRSTEVLFYKMVPISYFVSTTYYDIR